MALHRVEWRGLVVAAILAFIARPMLAEPPSDADFQKHVAALKKKHDGKAFQFVVERPFVVIGDESERAVKDRAVNTVRWAVERLKKDYFSDDPNHVIDIWLFKDKTSYEKNAQEIFGDAPTTPYGYYSHQHRALIMNISTGGGTLVHEIVHPFIAANFPKCPSWFNEGLASLYEQCRDNDGHIWGDTNWRLPGLQRAIRGESLPSFETLCKTTTQEFYGGDHAATNYGQARYLCYHLQQRGLLVDFYQRFKKNAAKDPSGHETLKAVLGETDAAAFQKKWQAETLKLKYR